MRYILLIAGLAALALPGPAFAADIAALVAEMAQDQHDAADLKGQQDGLTSASQTDLKAYKAYSESFGQLEAQKKAKSDVFLADAQRRMKSSDDMVDEWNGKCAKDQVGELPEAAFNACLASKAQLEPVVAAIRSSVEADADHFQHEQLDPIQAIQDRQKAEMNAITLRVKDRFAVWETLKAKSDALKARMQDIRTALVDECAAASTPEALKYCNAIGWDGARRDLPPLGDIHPTFGASPNN